MAFLKLLPILSVLSSIFYCVAFQCSSSRYPTAGRLSLQMKKGSLKGETNVLPTENVSRRMRRLLKTISVENFDKIYAPEFDSYLRELPDGRLYEGLINKVKKTARHLGLEFKNTFGLKEVIVLPDIVDTATAAGIFGTLTAALSAAGLVETLKGAGPFTVFAPSDEAFAKLPAGTIDELLADIPKLSGILTYHVSTDYYKSKKILKKNNEKIATVSGKDISVKVGKVDGVATLDAAKFVKTDIKCSNGIIHVIDSVLMPK